MNIVNLDTETMLHMAVLYSVFKYYYLFLSVYSVIHVYVCHVRRMKGVYMRSDDIAQCNEFNYRDINLSAKICVNIADREFTELLVY